MFIDFHSADAGREEKWSDPGRPAPKKRKGRIDQDTFHRLSLGKETKSLSGLGEVRMEKETTIIGAQRRIQLKKKEDVE